MDRTGESLLRSLQEALQRGGLREWETFIQHAHPVVAGAAYRGLARCGTPRKEQVDDLVQETFLKLCRDDSRALRGFQSSSAPALLAYLRMITTAVVIDAQRADLTQKRGAGMKSADLDGAGAVATTHSIEEVEREMLRGQIARCLSGQAARDRQVFWLYYRHGLTSQAIASLRAVELTTSGVESLLRRLVQTVRKCLQAGAGQPAGQQSSPPGKGNVA